MTEIMKHEGGAVAPQSVVEFAIQHQVSPEVLERLVALQERVADRDARMAFFAALGAFQAECPQVRKSKTAQIITKSGAKYGYTYAPLDEITRTVNRILPRHGLSYSWDAEETKDGVRAVFILRHVDGHSERSSFTAPTDTAAAMSGAQKGGAALTYARRQSMEMGLGLSTSDDTDAALPPEPVVKISEAQAADLRALAEEVGANVPAFLKFMGVAGFDDLTVVQLAESTQLLERKRGT